MFRNMATIILEDYARYYSEFDKDALAKYLEDTFNNHVGQIKWERDVAMEQLEIHGIPFGRKKDVKAVVHDLWEMHPDGSGTCCNCHFTQKNVWDYDNWQNYCGHCGAKMDGKRKDTE